MRVANFERSSRHDGHGSRARVPCLRHNSARSLCLAGESSHEITGSSRCRHRVIGALWVSAARSPNG
jgi:hypothetical protein